MTTEVTRRDLDIPRWVAPLAAVVVIVSIALVAWQGSDRYTDALTSGLSLGAIYALLAMGFVLIFKATQVVNFAHGALAALGAYLVSYFAIVLDLPGRWLSFPRWIEWSMALVLAVLVTAVIGLIVERLAMRPMVGEPLFSVAMVTVGLDIVLRTVTNDYIGSDPRPLGDPWGAAVLEQPPLTIAHTEIVTIIITIILVFAVAWFFRTRLGVAMRATAFDQEAAMAQGISVGRIFAISWFLGAALAAVAGVFASVFPRASIGVGAGTAFVAFRAFPAIVLGGLDSIVGAVVGGFLIGLAESYAGTYFTWSGFGTGFSGIVPYLVMLGVLLVKPYGLFGTEEIRRV